VDWARSKRQPKRKRVADLNRAVKDTEARRSQGAEDENEPSPTKINSPYAITFLRLKLSLKRQVSPCISRACGIYDSAG